MGLQMHFSGDGQKTAFLPALCNFSRSHIAYIASLEATLFSALKSILEYI